MTDAERYVNLGDLKIELPFTSSDFQLDDSIEEGEDYSDWDDFLLDLLEEESSRLEGWFEDHNFETDPPKTPVKEGVIRLVRLRLDLVNSDGLEDESLGDGSSFSYSDPRKIRNEVKSDISELVVNDRGGAWVV